MSCNIDVCRAQLRFPSLAGLSVPQVKTPVEVQKKQQNSGPRAATPSGYVKGEFLRGPIPLSWLGRASELSGKALAVALAVWFLVGLRNRKHQLNLTAATMKRFGVDRFAKSRALKALEAAGLLLVERRPRRNPVVTILDVAPSEEVGPASRKKKGREPGKSSGDPEGLPMPQF